MSNIIKLKRGLSSKVGTLTLERGELALTTDTNELLSVNDAGVIESITPHLLSNGKIKEQYLPEFSADNTTYVLSKEGATIKLTGSDGSVTSVSDTDTKVTVDSALSSSSTNPVQNKVINAALANKANTSAIPTKTSQLTNDSGFKTTDNNTTYTLTQDSTDGHKITLTPSSGTATTITIPDNNTTYSNMTAATSSAAGKAGLVPAPAAGKQASFLRGDGTWVVPTNTTYSNMTAATASAAGKAGLVPAPGAGKQASFLRGDGTWVVPTNTTYSAATTSAAGLMSAADKTKLDGIAASANNYILPAATTVLGGVKTTSTVTSTSGLTACPIIDGTVYYKDTNTTYSVATQSANGLMSANDKKALDGMAATTTTPKAAGTAAVGSETKYARGDHVHPAQTTVSGNAGSATKLATARNFTIGKTAKSFNGTAAVSWSLDEIGSNVYVGTTAPTDADVDVWVDPTGSINLSALWNSIYPVGSIYMSTSSTNPGTLFTGTTWSQITDRFLVAMGSTYKTAGGTGGASSVTLATGNLPSHSHSVSITTGNQSAGHTHSIPALSGTAASAGSHNHLVTSKTTSYGQGSQSSWRCLSWTGTNADWTQNIYSGDSGAHTHSVTTTASTSGGISANHTHSVSGNTGSQGSGTAFSIIPPYYAVYMWRRTA